MAKDNLIPLSPAETEILRLVWELNGATVQRICDALPENRNIAYATVQTMLRRMEKKGYLSHEVQGKAYVFVPKARQKDVIGSAVRSFVDRLFGGDAVPLIQYLAENREITREDIDRLKSILDEESSPS